MWMYERAKLPGIVAAQELTPSWDSPESHIGIARKLRDTIPHAIILDQYSNPHNPLAHYYGTYPEIRSSLAGSTFDNKNVSALFAGAGTGGTITGLARGIRDDESEAGPSRKRAKIVAIDPEGSILGGGDVVGSYEVEGIGYVGVDSAWSGEGERNRMRMRRGAGLPGCGQLGLQEVNRTDETGLLPRGA